MHDDGNIIEWVLQSVIRHIRTFEKDYYPTDNVLLMCFEFGIANQYSIDLAANTKRGLHEKVKRGEYPGVAPHGYRNDTTRKLVAFDKREAPVILRTYKLCAENKSRLEDLSMFILKNGIKTRATKRWKSEGGRPLSRDQITRILTNPFYMGMFRYAGELYEGKHPALVSKKLFDKVQEVLKERGRPHHEPENDPRPLCGLIRCGECGRSITAEEKIKRQKNGNVHTYVYYRYTKKNAICSQPFIREEELASQLSEIMGQYVLPQDWAAELLKMADKDERETIQSSVAASQAMRDEISAIGKKGLEEKMADISKGVVAWLEPLRGWIEDAENLTETALTPTLSLKNPQPKNSLARPSFLKTLVS